MISAYRKTVRLKVYWNVSNDQFFVSYSCREQARCPFPRTTQRDIASTYYQESWAKFAIELPQYCSSRYSLRSVNITNELLPADIQKLKMQRFLLRTLITSPTDNKQHHIYFYGLLTFRLVCPASPLSTQPHEQAAASRRSLASVAHSCRSSSSSNCRSSCRTEWT